MADLSRLDTDAQQRARDGLAALKLFFSDIYTEELKRSIHNHPELAGALRRHDELMATDLTLESLDVQAFKTSADELRDFDLETLEDLMAIDISVYIDQLDLFLRRFK